LSNLSTSDEADEHQLSINKRRQPKPKPNKQRKKKKRKNIHKRKRELNYKTMRFTSLEALLNKFNPGSESHDRVLQNAWLKEEVSDLRRMHTDLQIGSPYISSLKELEEVPCNTSRLGAELSNQSISA
ncbi:LOW QUALITY PROTEIN: hypothetical protein CFOL_v3_35877, partial [Cephalotus follicularis]